MGSTTSHRTKIKARTRTMVAGLTLMRRMTAILRTIALPMGENVCDVERDIASEFRRSVVLGAKASCDQVRCRLGRWFHESMRNHRSGQIARSRFANQPPNPRTK
jgi:hypothetical protein